MPDRDLEIFPLTSSMSVCCGPSAREVGRAAGYFDSVGEGSYESVCRRTSRSSVPLPTCRPATGCDRMRHLRRDAASEEATIGLLTAGNSRKRKRKRSKDTVRKMALSHGLGWRDGDRRRRQRERTRGARENRREKLDASSRKESGRGEEEGASRPMKSHGPVYIKEHCLDARSPEPLFDPDAYGIDVAATARRPKTPTLLRGLHGGGKIWPEFCMDQACEDQMPTHLKSLVPCDYPADDVLV